MVMFLTQRCSAGLLYKAVIILHALNSKKYHQSHAQKIMSASHRVVREDLS